MSSLGACLVLACFHAILGFCQLVPAASVKNLSPCNLPSLKLEASRNCLMWQQERKKSVVISNRFFVLSLATSDFDRLVLLLFVLGLSQGKRGG